MSATIINQIVSGGSGGSTAATEKDVNFYDYDGTLVAGYTIAEAQALSALPSAPDHSTEDVPLTFQEWNYTLAQVNATTSKMDVGANYVPTDGKTHFIIRVTAVSGGSIPFYFTKSNATDTLSIDYGDGQTDSDSTNTNVTFTPSTDLSVGDHDVKVWISSGSGAVTLGQNSSSTAVVGLKQTLLYAFLNSDVTIINGYAFYYCYSLTSISIPSSVTSINDYTFYNCALPSISIPSSVTSIGSYAFRGCYYLTSISIPSGVTIINSYVFQYCYGFPAISIPNGVTSIGSYAFGYCYSILEYDFSACTAVPTLPSTNAFFLINSVCIMKIPSALYSAWSTATNWSTYASYMVAV